MLRGRPGVIGDTLHLRGIDLVDGTPILDVKPYVPFADGHQWAPTPTVAHWLEHRPTAVRPTAASQPSADWRLSMGQLSVK